MYQVFEDGIQQSCEKGNATLNGKCFVLFDLLKENDIPIDEISDALTKLNKIDLLINELDSVLYNQLKDYYRTYKYTNTKFVQTIIDNLIKIYSKEPELKLKKIFAYFHRINFELDIHGGKELTNKWELFENYCNMNQKLLFKSPVEQYIEILSAKLVYFQYLFNSLDFQKVEDTIKPDKIKWEKINALLETNKNTQNILAAEIHGTLGQAYIFQGDLENSPFDKQEGLTELEKDLNYLDPGSREYEHVANFIVTYYWLQNDLKAGLKAFENLKGSPNENNLYSITKTGSNSYSDPITTDIDIYKYLNQIRLISLGVENDKILSKDIIENIKTQIEKICHKEIAYPKFMILKWLCYIYHKHQNEIPTCVIEKLKTPQDIETPLLKMMAFPLYYLIGNKELYLAKINEFDSFCQSEGAISFLIHRKTLIDKIKNGSATQKEVMRLMPYYYS